jgi:hypothetical protein
LPVATRARPPFYCTGALKGLLNAQLLSLVLPIKREEGSFLS